MVAAAVATLGGVAPAVAAPPVAPDAAERTGAGDAVASALKPPRVIGHECRGDDGVTAVVDFRNLHNPNGSVMNKVKIGCARGPQQDGLSALTEAGFTVDPASAFVCEIDNRPLPVDSVCASTGYWSYWHADRDGEWEFSGVGPADWAPPAGSLEGWSWSPYDKEWDGPRVTPDELFPPPMRAS